MSEQSKAGAGQRPVYGAGSARPMACPVCGDAAHLRMLCHVDGFDILACDTCGAEHAAPVPSAQALKAYYDRRDWFEGGERGGYSNYDAQTAWSLETVQHVLNSFENGDGLSVLDVGCGYGTHLAVAAARGWKCFGVEISEHARGVAKERLAGAAYIVERIDELIPHEFDLVLILDTIEHLASPYAMLYDLFSIGAITPKTRVVISTPNAGSAAALRDPAAWPYRHPPSHLVFYNARSLDYLLRRLHFTAVDVRGLSPTEHAADAGDLANHAGLLVTAHGSDFTEFMRERYVPGTWSKIAAYEHVPRYVIAKDLVAGKTVLDFGCGTGYGAAMLADRAASVTGLDIDAAAIAWARETHRNPAVTYLCQGDLGASLPAASFDVVTCFEMIEHVDHDLQKAVVASFARLMRDDGVMLISTPNPETTKLYGANPYHIREMNEAELRELLAPHFQSIQILRQYVRSGVMFDQANGGALKPQALGSPDSSAHDEPLAFIAVCAKGASLPAVPPQILFDQEVDYIADFMRRQRVLNNARFEAYGQAEMAHNYQKQVKTIESAYKQEIQEKHQAIQAQNAALHEKNLALQARAEAVHERNLADAERDQARMAYHHLSLQRDAELASPRFLLRRFLTVVRQRVSAKFLHLRSRILPPVLDDRAQAEATEQALAALMLLPPTQAASQPPLRCSLIIPTKNGGDLFKRVVAGLQRQTIWPHVEFIVIDSGSTDDTLAVAAAAGATCVSISSSEFNHGATRDQAIGLAQCERVVLMVQDAIPSSAGVLEHLIAVLDDDAVAGGYARQIPQPDADPITRRNLNMWLTGRLEADVHCLERGQDYDAFSPLQKYLFCNFDNVCSVIRKSVWQADPFGHADFGEDIDWAERVLKKGHKIVYEPQAAVVHSHDRPLPYEYARTYLCHRKLYAQFGLRQVPSLPRLLVSWVGLTVCDIIYIVRASVPLGFKLKTLLKIPALNGSRVLGQYRGAKDEMAGRPSRVRGV